MKKTLSLLLACLMLVALVSGCATNTGSPTGGSNENPSGNAGESSSGETTPDGTESSYTPPASDVSAELTIMMWSGDGSYMQDIGHKDYTPQDLLGQNQAAAYATAKAFNEIFPNVKINIFAKVDGPNDGGMQWAQHIENFRAEYGFYPDFYAATDIPGDIAKGMCADLSIFSEDPVYKTFNEGIMSLMNYDGHQFALPQFLQPWGVFVNKSLAEAQNINVPNYDWTIDDYTEFTAHSSPNEYYGAMDTPFDFVRTGTKDFAYNLVNRGADDIYVNLASDATFKLMEYLPKWANHAVYPQNDIGSIDESFMVANDNWSYNFFKNGKLLTLAGDPWMMGDAAHPDPNHWGIVQAADWDIYPRPSTDYVGNTVGVVLDPFAVHNYAMDDGNAALSDDEYNKLQIAYEFAKFWCGDTRAMKARAEQMWDDKGTLKTAMNDSLPLVTGDAFNEQMEIWYTSQTHQRFADKDKMPGFHYVLDLWQDGQIWDVSDKAYPWYYEYEGSVREIVYEFLNSWNPDLVGARRTDANWLDNLKARMPDWNTQFNERFTAAFKGIYTALDKYYRVG